MPLPLDPQQTIYQQIAQLIEDGILSGAMPEDSAVPSINQLARLYQINPATALKGVTLLADERLIYKRRGLGMFIAPGARERLKSKRRAAFEREYVAPLMREGSRLDMGTDEILGLITKHKEETDHE